jgi:hypothetical protein
MSRVRLPLAAALAFAALATPAAAQPGKLYEPFPEPPDEAQIIDYVRKLPGGGGEIARGLSNRDLERGEFVGRLSPGVAAPRGASGPASDRAEARSDLGPSMGWALTAGLLVLAIGGAGVLASRPA